MPSVYIPKAAVATEWVTTANISGTGTANVEAAVMLLPIPNVPMIDWAIELYHTVNRTAGTNSAQSYFRLDGFQGDATVSAGATVSFYTSMASATGTANVVKHYLLKPSVLSDGATTANANNLYIRTIGKANNADTSFEVKDIKARLIYVPV